MEWQWEDDKRSGWTILTTFAVSLKRCYSTEWYTLLFCMACLQIACEWANLEDLLQLTSNNTQIECVRMKMCAIVLISNWNLSAKWFVQPHMNECKRWSIKLYAKSLAIRFTKSPSFSGAALVRLGINRDGVHRLCWKKRLWILHRHFNESTWMNSSSKWSTLARCSLFDYYLFNCH